MVASRTPAWETRSRGGCGRADLLRALDTPSGVAAAAALLGYVEVDRKHDTDDVGSSATGALVAKSPGHLAKKGEHARPTPFWRLEAIDQEDPLGDERIERESALDVDSLRDLPGKPPPTPPIVSPARLLPALARRLASRRPGPCLDVERLIERWSRGALVDTVPRLPVLGWCQQVVVLVDRSRRLVPFWDDQDVVVAFLKRCLGPRAVLDLTYDGGSFKPWRMADGQGFHAVPARVGDAVLALSDLGFYAGSGARAAWRETGHDLRRRGATLHALVPCSPNRWQIPLAKLWSAIDWAWPNRAPRRAPPLAAAVQSARVEKLLCLVAPAFRVEPGLLRALRRLLPAAEADLGTEHDAWNHPAMIGRNSVAGRLDDDARRRWRETFRDEPAERKRAASKLMHRWRVGSAEEMRLEEVAGLLVDGDVAETISADEHQRCLAFFQRLATLVAEASDFKGHASEPATWFVSLRPRMPKAVWDHREIGPALKAAWWAIPPALRGVDTDLLAPGDRPRGGGGHVGCWQAVQAGAYVCFVPEQAVEVQAVDRPSSPLATLLSAGGGIKASTGWAPEQPLGHKTRVDLRPHGENLTIQTDRTKAILRRWHRPDWANAGAGRDRYGLWAAFEVKGVVQRMRWMPPGRFMMGSPNDEPGRWEDEGPRYEEQIAVGFWLAETPCTQALWMAIAKKNPSNFQKPKLLTRPVERVSWDDSRDWLSELNRLIPGLDARLPWENEWEYACRAGTETAIWTGELDTEDQERALAALDPIAWYSENSEGKTQPVGKRQPNPWGLFDMLGNVEEWCFDRWRSNYKASMGSSRVIRGGGWYGAARGVRAAYRSANHLGFRWSDLGFRLARDQGAALSQRAEPKDKASGEAELGAGRAGDAEASGGKRGGR